MLRRSGPGAAAIAVFASLVIQGCSKTTAPSRGSVAEPAGGSSSAPVGDAAAEAAPGAASTKPDADQLSAGGASSRSCANGEILPIERKEYPGCKHPPVEDNCKDGWCTIPAGCFIMGSAEGEWRHARRSENETAVTLTRSFVIQQTEFTRRHWFALGLQDIRPLTNGWEDGCTQADCPVSNASLYDAATIANRLSESEGRPVCYELSGCTGQVGVALVCEGIKEATPTLYECTGYRLPTEAEWEYAARAGTRTTFYSGDITVYGGLENLSSACCPDPNLEAVAWYCHNAGTSPRPVGQKLPNAWGLLDTLGNVKEWVTDPRDGQPVSADVDPDGTMSSQNRSYLKGGRHGLWSSLCRAASHTSGTHAQRGIGFGFRLVRTLPSNGTGGSGGK